MEGQFSTRISSLNAKKSRPEYRITATLKQRSPPTFGILAGSHILHVPSGTAPERVSGLPIIPNLIRISDLWIIVQCNQDTQISVSSITSLYQLLSSV